MAKMTLEGDEDEVVSLGRRLFRGPELPPPPDSVYPPGIDGLGSPPDFLGSSGSPFRNAGSETVVAFGPNPTAGPIPFRGFACPPSSVRGADAPTRAGNGTRVAPHGVLFRAPRPEEGQPLTLADARALFDGLAGEVRSLSRRVEVAENTLGIQAPEPGENHGWPDDDEGPDDPRDDADEPDNGSTQGHPAGREEQIRAEGDQIRAAIRGAGPVPSGDASIEDGKEALRMRLFQGRRASLASVGDIEKLEYLCDMDPELDGLRLLDALRRAKALLGPNAIAIRMGEMYTVQDSPEPAKVLGTGADWDAALADAARVLGLQAGRTGPPILPDQDLPYPKALAYAQKAIGAGVLLSFSPADSTRTRVCLSLPVGTIGRKMILAGSFLEAIAEYMGVSVDDVRQATGHLAPETPEESLRRLEERQRKDCATPGVCCTPPAPEGVPAVKITDDTIADVERAEREALERQRNNGLTDEEKNRIDTAV